MKSAPILFAFLICIIFTSCQTKEAVNIAGSTSVLPIISIAAEEFRKNNPELTIIVNGGGSGVGVNQLGEGKINIGMVSRDITQEEISAYPNINFNPISIGKDAVVPVISSEIYNYGITSLTLEQIAKIYRGEVRNWNKLGGPDKEILVIDKEASRGTRHVFMEIVLGDKEAIAAGTDLVLGSNNEEQTAIVQSDAAIGMLSNAWLNEDVKGLNIKMLDGTIIEPTLNNIINNKFPITRDLLIVTNGKPAGAVKYFIEYLLSSEGQKIVEEAGYVGINQ
ncbi:phosphate transport system substrate-binding protein [Gillisia sp. Hel_I_86]|uniref:phosphate ABC transporter substrate-binding protein n=1 Tax=Gillisia sp. Hel_I_86 TaxID=1249981 RepID=UPI00119C815A|nr:phosphate ABC transporter substrate-binding protein [Gillisia sp. Hel_I_86]TVZ28330.1 phosphate transport system substrate-binding protein [Gillisia sp. Hel_I_86]